MSTPTQNKCPDCGKELQAHEMATHHLDCRMKPKRKPGRPKSSPVELKAEVPIEHESIPLDVIKQIASGTYKPEVVTVEAEVCFDCTICGEAQPINGAHNWGKEIVFPVCDNCKSDLKEIILNKRKKDEKDS